MAPDTVPNRPPIPDIDWTEAVEAAAQVLHAEYDSQYTIAPWHQLGRIDRETFMDQAAAVVQAVWPILHEAAQPIHDGTHHYLSTGCLHELCEPECGAAQRARGDMSHPHCKYCPAPCTCACHQGQNLPKPPRMHTDACTLTDRSHSGWCGTE
jgi:hypothetical protein